MGGNEAVDKLAQRLYKQTNKVIERQTWKLHNFLFKIEESTPWMCKRLCSAFHYFPIFLVFRRSEKKIMKKTSQGMKITFQLCISRAIAGLFSQIQNPNQTNNLHPVHRNLLFHPTYTAELSRHFDFGAKQGIWFSSIHLPKSLLHWSFI